MSVPKRFKKKAQILKIRTSHHTNVKTNPIMFMDKYNYFAPSAVLKKKINKHILYKSLNFKWYKKPHFIFHT